MRSMHEEKILLAHGGGGILMRELVAFIIERLGEIRPGPQKDSAVLETKGGRLAFAAGSFVVDPLFFPGGDIGRLAVCGTVNDLAVSGAVPWSVSMSMIIEEGMPVEMLGRIVDSIAAAAREAGVRIVTGDTKVVGRGKADRIFISTSGLGWVPEDVEVSSAAARPGDAVIINGTIGDHGLTILSMREGLDFGSGLESDTMPLSTIIVPMLAGIEGIRGMRDATRGGVAAALNEIAADSKVCIRVKEDDLPVSPQVRAGCDLMGYEPLNMANEGKFIAIVDRSSAGRVLEHIRSYPSGKDAAVIGEVAEGPAGMVVLETPYGGERVIDLPYGDLLPRIC